MIKMKNPMARPGDRAVHHEEWGHGASEPARVVSLRVEYQAPSIVFPAYSNPGGRSQRLPNKSLAVIAVEAGVR
ncbi:hypothetical protein JW848_10890 [Candidatus Bipolaricaulota bacterium]|nr:hypothetical protein [Candidatus Bipolaricaulota bacterium]